MSEKICCAICAKQYYNAYAGSETGYGCAGYVKNGVLTGHYGSVIADMTAFDIKGLDLQEGGPICDDCIAKMIDAGQLVEIPRQAAAITPESDELRRIFLKELA